MKKTCKTTFPAPESSPETLQDTPDHPDSQTSSEEETFRSTIFDDVFRTMIEYFPSLIVSIINEVFGVTVHGLPAHLLSGQVVNSNLLLPRDQVTCSIGYVAASILYFLQDSDITSFFLSKNLCISS